MRAILVVNPKATTTSELSRDVLVRALRSELDIRVEYTRRRGHAADLAREARDEQVDVVITLGGDGTVNEVVNGLLQDGPWESGDAAGRGNTDKVPALAVVPGGSTNVFARALGLPRDAVEGTGVILDALHNGRVRSVGLGRADGRYFTFCAGFGLDAEVVRKVERARLRGRVSTPGLYLRSTVAQFLLDSDRKTPMITLECPGEETQQEIASVIIQNTAPWTFLGDRPINSCPDASFDTGLDLMAMKALRLPATARTVTQLLSRRGNPHGKQVMTLHDLPEFTLRAVRPMAFQLDGDYLGERSKITFTSMPGALRVFC
jgi:diacylglycerol kinase family enzyme